MLVFLSAVCRALKEADVILLLGARLNWILHFGRPPRFKPDVKIIQVCILLSSISSGLFQNMYVHRPLNILGDPLRTVCYLDD